MKTIKLTSLLLLALVAGFASLPAYAGAPNCANFSNSTLVEWPAGDPVWEFCYRRAQFSQPTPDGSGLELFDVHYNGHLVFARTHVPILNVEYGPGGCGCFRDWLDSERSFEASGSPCSGGFCDADTQPRTICDCAPTNSCDGDPSNACNVDIGNFAGVAAFETPEMLELTTQTSAGWYRYIMKWRFFLDGSLEPVFEFGARPNGCTDASHFHHGYYRFDFDINGADNDQIYTEDSTLSGLDTDGDSIDDALDNCTNVPNPNQVDADNDSFGNRCDADLNNDGVVNPLDLGLMKTAFFGTDPVADLNADGVVNALDLGFLKAQFFGPPGPAGSGSTLTAILTEQGGYATDGIRWVVEDTATGRGYRVIPGANDQELSADTFDPVEFAAGDYWVLAESASEIDDGVSFGGGCAAQLDDFVDGESTASEDVVLWYRLGTQHVGLDECFCGSKGPRLEPIGDWSRDVTP